MYCPNCAAPIEGAKFCRSCGANVSLVPQALSGRLPEVQVTESKAERRRHRHHDPASAMANGVRQAIFGFGFLIVALALMFSGQDWGVWMLIPGFAILSSGIAQLVSASLRAKSVESINPPAIPPTPRVAEMSAPNTAHITPPPSIVEDTTQRFDPAKRSGEKR